MTRPERFAIRLLSCIYVLSWLALVGYEHSGGQFGEGWRRWTA